MEYLFLLDAHRSVNVLLHKLALGMERTVLNREIIQLTEHLFGKRKASILMLNSESGTLHLEYAPNLPSFYSQAIEGVAIGENVGSCGAAAFLKKPIIVDDINTHPNWSPFTELTQQANLHACWSVPIMTSKGSVLGTFAIYSEYPSIPNEFELEILDLLASLYSVALEKYELEVQLKFHADRDSLTHCYNRRALLKKASLLLKERCFGQKIMACLFIDIDKFKYINDTFGHQLGDEILITVADTLTDSMVHCAKIGRYGGDEFVAFSCFTSEQEAQQFLLYLNEQLAAVLNVNNHQFSVSVGMACSKQNEEVDLPFLIAQADKNMYKIKQNKVKW